MADTGGDDARVIPVRRAVPPSELKGRCRRVLAAWHRLLQGAANHFIPGSQQPVAVRMPTGTGRTGRAWRDFAAGAAPVKDIEAVWARIKSHAREEFHTKTGLPFRY